MNTKQENLDADKKEIRRMRVGVREINLENMGLPTFNPFPAGTPPLLWENHKIKMLNYSIEHDVPLKVLEDREVESFRTCECIGGCGKDAECNGGFVDDKEEFRIVSRYEPNFLVCYHVICAQCAEAYGEGCPECDRMMVKPAKR